jgi:hypothetical protein
MGGMSWSRARILEQEKKNPGILKSLDISWGRIQRYFVDFQQNFNHMIKLIAINMCHPIRVAQLVD